jgi:hypothetical protein
MENYSVKYWQFNALLESSGHSVLFRYLKFRFALHTEQCRNKNYPKRELSFVPSSSPFVIHLFLK